MKYVVTSIRKSKYYFIDISVPILPIYRVYLESIEDPKIWAKFTASVGVPFDEKPWVFEGRGNETPYKYVIEMKELLDKCKKEELKYHAVLGEEKNGK